MIEKFCPEHGIPVKGSTCSKEGCKANLISSVTIYYCKECNVPSFEKICSCCGNEGKYIASDIRPVFPEEKLLVAIASGMETPFDLDNKPVWCSNSGYFIDGERFDLSIGELNRLPLDEIKKFKDKYDEFIELIDESYFDEMVTRFIKVNQNRYYELTDEAISYIQSFEEKYAFDDMFVSFSGGKDSTVTSDLVTRAFSTNKITHIYGDTTLEFDSTEEYRKRFAKQ